MMSPRLPAQPTGLVAEIANQVDLILDECATHMTQSGTLKQTAVKDMESSIGVLFKKLSEGDQAPAVCGSSASTASGLTTAPCADIDDEDTSEKASEPVFSMAIPSAATDCRTPAAAAALEAALEEAKGDNGKFALRGGVLGNKWARALQESPGLKEDYSATGTTEKAAEFRAMWVDAMWSQMQKKKTESRPLYEDNKNVGRFLPIGVWVDKEGNDLAAIQGIRHFLQKVVHRKDWKRFVDVDEWTGRLEIALPKKQWSAGNDRRFEISSTSTPVAADQSSNAKAQPPKAQPRVAGTKQNPPNTPAKAGAPGLKRLKSSANLGSPPEKKQCAEHWKTLLSTKDLVDKALSKAGMLARNSSTMAAWKWVCKMDEFDVVQAAHGRLQKASQADQFWQRLSLNDIVKVKKEVSPGEIQTVVASLVPQLKADAQKVFDNIAVLNDMQRAKVGTT